MHSNQTGHEKKYFSHQKYKIVEQPFYCNSAAFKMELNGWELSGMKETQQPRYSCPPAVSQDPHCHLWVQELRTGTGWDPRSDCDHFASSPMPSPGPAEPGGAVWVDSRPVAFPHCLGWLPGGWQCCHCHCHSPVQELQACTHQTSLPGLRVGCPQLLGHPEAVSPASTTPFHP